MKTVNDLIAELKNLPKELRNKPVVIAAPNGLEFEPVCKRVVDLDKGQTIFDDYCHTEKMAITYE